MADTKLASPRIRVVRESVEEPIELQCDNRDLILWDQTRARHKWPKFDEAPFMWLTFLSWAAARRTGQINGETTYEVWSKDVIGVESMDDEDEENATGRPTPSGLVPD